MTIRVAINGFGRIGRNVFRQLLKYPEYQKDIEIVAINDLTDTSTIAHLFKYDSVHGKLENHIEVAENGILVDGKLIKISAERDPAKLDHKANNVDVAFECTGIFTKREKAALHLSAGARKVLISAPSPDADVTICYGVNDDEYNGEEIISNASCTTNCLAPVAKVIYENFGTVSGTMTTIHSYTNDQNILDLPHKDLRRARAAALSMIPTTTGAAKALGLVVKPLKGLVDGFAVRVPTPNVSLVDYVAVVNKDTSVEEVNSVLKAASGKVLGYCEEPLVSCDFIGAPHSSTVDAKCTMVINKRMVKVVTWYDNEIGFSNRMLDVAKLVASK